MKAKTVLIIIAATCAVLFVFYGKNEGPIVDEAIVDAVKDWVNAEGGKAFEPSDFDPYHERPSKAVHVTAGTMADFRKAFKGK